jgi:hypothetical protein
MGNHQGTPIASVKRVKAEEENRVRWLSNDDEKRLKQALKKAPGHLRAMTLRVMNTQPALRRGIPVNRKGCGAAAAQSHRASCLCEGFQGTAHSVE